MEWNARDQESAIDYVVVSGRMRECVCASRVDRLILRLTFKGSCRPECWDSCRPEYKESCRPECNVCEKEWQETCEQTVVYGMGVLGRQARSG